MKTTRKEHKAIANAIETAHMNAIAKGWEVLDLGKATDNPSEPVNEFQAVRHAYMTNTMTKAHRRTLAKWLRNTLKDAGMLERFTINKLIRRLEW